MNRVESMLERDKVRVCEEVLKLFESEVEKVAQSLVVLASGVKVRYRITSNEPASLHFMIEFDADRIRPLGYLPPRY